MHTQQKCRVQTITQSIRNKTTETKKYTFCKLSNNLRTCIAREDWCDLQCLPSMLQHLSQLVREKGGKHTLVLAALCVRLVLLLLLLLLLECGVDR